MFAPKRLSYDMLREEAEAFLLEYHEERTLPVPIEEVVEFDFEIEVIPVEGILEDLKVDAFLTGDLKRIYIDADVLEHSERRARFSLAHELSHFWLHQALYESVQIRSVQDWHRVQEQIGEEAYSWFEYQAYAMAGLVLVPKAELAARFREAMDAGASAGLSEETLWSDAGKLYIVSWLADAFNVSSQVIERRLEKDGLWLPPERPR